MELYESFHRAFEYRAKRAFFRFGSFTEHVGEIICNRTDEAHRMSAEFSVLAYVAAEESAECVKHQLMQFGH